MVTLTDGFKRTDVVRAVRGALATDLVIARLDITGDGDTILFAVKTAGFMPSRRAKIPAPEPKAAW